MHRRSYALIVGVVALAMTGCQANRTNGSPSAKDAHKLATSASTHTVADSAAKAKAKTKVKTDTEAHRRSVPQAGTDVFTTRPSAQLPKGATARPATPHGAPGMPSAGQLQHLGNSVGTVIKNQCPPLGAKNYEKACVNDTHNYLRWGNEPYFNTHKRYIFVVDEFTPGSRASFWLQATINTLNKYADSQNKPDGADRPHFIYLDLATAKIKSRGKISGGCSSRERQIVEMCAYDAHNPAHRRSKGTHFELFQSGPHIVGGHGIIRFRAGETDQAIESAVVHEMGHAVGFAHDMDCTSVMSDCGTQQERDSHYMWFGPNQIAAYHYLYVHFPRN